MFASCVVYLLFAILTPDMAADADEPVTCQNCDSFSSCDDNCTVTAKEGGCFTTVQENSFGGGNETFFSKECLKFAVTPVFFSISPGKGHFLRNNISFCKEDKCNYGDFSISTDLTQNGRECPSCFNSTDNSCTVETVPCTGIETYCASAYGIVRKKDSKEVFLFVAQGCATESVKDIHPPLNISLLSETYTVLKMKTYKAPPVALTTAASIVTSPTTKHNGAPTLKSISFVLLLAGLSRMLLVNVVF